MSSLVGVVLAGGRGERLGRTKGDLLLEGRNLSERAASTLWTFCGSVLISVGPGMDNPAPDHPVVVDGFPPGRGPLAGIDAAFAASGEADLLVLACDYPRVDEPFLRRLLGFVEPEDDLVMPTDHRGRDHPLVALWTRRTAPEVGRALAEERFKVRSLLPEWRVRRVGPEAFGELDPRRALANVNRPEDLARL